MALPAESDAAHSCGGEIDTGPREMPRRRSPGPGSCMVRALRLQQTSGRRAGGRLPPCIRPLVGAWSSRALMGSAHTGPHHFISWLHRGGRPDAPVEEDRRPIGIERTGATSVRRRTRRAGSPSSRRPSTVNWSCCPDPPSAIDHRPARAPRRSSVLPPARGSSLRRVSRAGAPSKIRETERWNRAPEGRGKCRSGAGCRAIRPPVDYSFRSP